jgi:uncharacterized membrane protein YhhN
VQAAPHLFVGGAVLAAVGYIALRARGRKGPVKLLPALLCVAALVTTSWVVAAAMALWAAGDWALLSERRFLAGLVSFLLGHLLFIGALAPSSYGAFHPAAVAAITVAVVGMLALLLPRVDGVLRLAVPVYALALGAMALVVSTLGTLGATGGVLFVISDATLALDKFRGRIPGAVYGVITTYYAAVVLVTEAILLRD